MNATRVVGSRDNPLLVRVRKLAQDGSAYRRGGQVWVEGEHLCTALRSRARPAATALIAESAWADAPALRGLAGWAAETVIVADRLFAALSGLGSPARIGFLVDVGAPASIEGGLPTVVLDRLQDAGNVGSILRSAALWSPKVLRAGMGAHFALRLVEGLDEDALAALAVPRVATSSHRGQPLREAVVPRPCAWVFGNEGQGVAPALLARCALTVRIPQPGGEESLNVAAAAAICLYESSTRAAA